LEGFEGNPYLPGGCTGNKQTIIVYFYFYFYFFVL
jgi:hypothetical protein